MIRELLVFIAAVLIFALTAAVLESKETRTAMENGYEQVYERGRLVWKKTP
jgi:archaellum component FlaG (FlaF/FlaG flagellin family)